MNNIRPSSLPKLAACARWASDGNSGIAAERGTDLHAAIEAGLRGDMSLHALLDESDRGAADWGMEYVRTVMPLDDHELKSEMPVEIRVGQWEPFSGTLDHACGVHVVDIKSGQVSDYNLQLVAYALGYMQATGHDRVCCHVAYIDQKRSVQFWLGRDECEERLTPVLNAVYAQAPATPCDYCKWCANRLACPALRETTELVSSRLDLDGWEPPTVNLLANPEVAAKTMAGIKVVKEWCAATEEHIKARMMEGMEVPGYRLITSMKRDLPAQSIPQAFGALGISQGAFLGACSVGLTKLEAAVAKEKDVVAVEAKRIVNDALGHLLRTTQITQVRKGK